MGVVLASHSDTGTSELKASVPVKKDGDNSFLELSNGLSGERM
jgi:hypothetical protein